ncbi:MAG: hypothetical protein MUC43_05725 [Pirellula sp.]|nr:hypothetical protein [Pirellula sp.]
MTSVTVFAEPPVFGLLEVDAGFSEEHPSDKVRQMMITKKDRYMLGCAKVMMLIEMARREKFAGNANSRPVSHRGDRS